MKQQGKIVIGKAFSGQGISCELVFKLVEYIFATIVNNGENIWFIIE